VTSAVIWRRALVIVLEILVMEITNRTVLQSPMKVRDHDGLILLGYLAFAIVAIAALYAASSGPGVTGADLALATVLP
jgi:hypothetical protein